MDHDNSDRRGLRRTLRELASDTLQFSSPVRPGRCSERGIGRRVGDLPPVGNRKGGLGRSLRATAFSVPSRHSEGAASRLPVVDPDSNPSPSALAFFIDRVHNDTRPCAAFLRPARATAIKSGAYPRAVGHRMEVER